MDTRTIASMGMWMAKGMGLRLRLRLALALVVGLRLRLRLEMVSPLSPNWARRSQKIATVQQQQSPFTLGRAECQRVASGGSGIGIDRLFNWLRCLPHPASSYPPRKQRRKWSDVDKAHPRQRRRLNCRTFYSRTYFKVCASASASRRSYRSSCCLVCPLRWQSLCHFAVQRATATANHSTRVFGRPLN